MKALFTSIALATAFSGMPFCEADVMINLYRTGDTTKSSAFTILPGEVFSVDAEIFSNGTDELNTFELPQHRQQLRLWERQLCQCVRLQWNIHRSNNTHLRRFAGTPGRNPDWRVTVSGGQNGISGGRVWRRRRLGRD